MFNRIVLNSSKKINNFNGSTWKAFDFLDHNHHDLGITTVVVSKLRFLSTTSYCSEKLASKPIPKPQIDWNRAVSDAEKIVGYPTSFLSLRWLLSDEIANVALHLRKLVGRGSTHPLLKTAKYLLYNGRNTMQAWGLITLLMAKTAGYSDNVPEMEQDKSAGVLHSQRALAEITEMIRISHLVHNSLVNLHPSTEAGKDMASIDEMGFGNKISLLSGDYLLAHSCAELANLRNQELVESLSSAVRDFTEAEFIGDRDEQNRPLPSNPNLHKHKESSVRCENEHYVETDLLKPESVDNIMGIPEKEWSLRHMLDSGTLLSKSCQGALKLGGLDNDIQKQGYLFGKHLSLAWQATLDLEPFQDDVSKDEAFSLISAPVVFHLHHDPEIYKEIEKGKSSVDNIDFKKLREKILNGPGIEKTRELQKQHSDKALKILENFPVSDARTALENILLAMQFL